MTHLKYHKIKNLSPVGRWLVEYTDEVNISLSQLAKRANLSAGTLRYLVIEPTRTPSLETCAKLSEATGVPLPEILKMGGLSNHQISYEPRREALLSAYDNLPTSMREVLVVVAQVLKESRDTILATENKGTIQR